jgi:hypothetical protein
LAEAGLEVANCIGSGQNPVCLVLLKGFSNNKQVNTLQQVASLSVVV